MLGATRGRTVWAFWKCVLTLFPSFGVEHPTNLTWKKESEAIILERERKGSFAKNGRKPFLFLGLWPPAVRLFNACVCARRVPEQLKFLKGNQTNFPTTFFFCAPCVFVFLYTLLTYLRFDLSVSVDRILSGFFSLFKRRREKTLPGKKT